MSDKAKPMLFSGPMVRALLAGTKTMTRRVITRFDLWPDGSHLPHECPNPVGTKLWVKETFRVWQGYDEDPDIVLGKLGQPKTPEQIDLWRRCVEYRATSKSDDEHPWRPSIFMPRWASRITLEVTAVRVERVKDISEEDAKAEGVPEEEYAVHYYCDDGDPNDPNDFGTHRCNWRFGYKMLWDSINGKKHPWVSNPWVWVYEFKRIKP